MPSDIIKSKQEYISLLAKGDFSGGALGLMRGKRQDLLALALTQADSASPSPESLFVAGLLTAEDPGTLPPALDLALARLKSAAAQGHVEAGLALCKILNGDYPHIPAHNVTRSAAHAALNAGLAQDHPYAHYLKARDCSRTMPDDEGTGQTIFKNEKKALEHLAQIKKTNQLCAHYLEATWLTFNGPGPGSRILAAGIMEKTLQGDIAVDLLSRDLIAASYRLLGHIYTRDPVIADAEKAAACHATADRIDHDGPPPENMPGNGGGPLAGTNDPMRFFADPHVTKNIYYNEPPPPDQSDTPFNFNGPHQASSASPLITDLGNGYCLIASPENSDHKPAVRVRIHYPSAEHTAMRERIAAMESLDPAVIGALLRPLNDMPGLADIKQSLNDLINLAYVMKHRRDMGLRTRDPGLHMIFSGNPGTGKTHIARLAGQVLYQIGFLDNGHVIEAHKSDLTGEYIGWSESKTNLLCQASFGGLLFIDEAYTLSEQSYSGANFGSEVISTLLKMMEDFSDRFIVIAAGYKDKMEEFVRSNPGLRSRFGQTIIFRNYTAEEMTEIFDLFARDHDYRLGDGTRGKITALLKSLKGVDYDRFGNARGVRNLFDQTLRLQSARLVREGRMDTDSLCTILPQDIPSDKPLSGGGGIAYLPTRK